MAPMEQLIPIESLLPAPEFAPPAQPATGEVHLPTITYREEPCRSALNRVSGMDFEWSLNPYTGCAHRCTYCYVRGFEQRADRPFDDRYGRNIRVKVNVAERLREELGRASWKRDFVLVGAATDPYQPAEGRYRLTRACIEAFADFRTPFGIITRGTMAVRDLDVLQRASSRASVSISFSIPTLDEKVWRTTEPGTSHPLHRLRTIRALVEGGVKASVAIAPVLPGLTDSVESLRAVIRAAREAGACGVWAAPLNLRPGTREHFFAALEHDWPAELPRYREMFATRAYLPKEYGAGLQEKVRALRKEFAIGDRRKMKLGPPPEAEQMELGM